MNKTIILRRYLRSIQRPLMMEYSEHESFSVCVRCNETVKAYTYIPVLENIFVCDKCMRKWTRWGISLFKDMINYE